MTERSRTSVLGEIQLSKSESKKPDISFSSSVCSCKNDDVRAVLQPDPPIPNEESAIVLLAEQPNDDEFYDEYYMQHGRHKTDVQNNTSSSKSMLVLIVIWQFMARGTLAVFVNLNDVEKHNNSQPMVFMVGISLMLLNMLLLHVFRAKHLRFLAYAYSAFSSLESIALMWFIENLLLTTVSIGGLWITFFLLVLNPWKQCKRELSCCKPNDDTLLSMDEKRAYALKKKNWWKTKRCIYAQFLLVLFVSFVAECGRIAYFWFLMQCYEKEDDPQTKRIILCCIALKLLISSYIRHLLFDRRASACSILCEFALFALTMAVVYAYAFLTLSEEQILILHYSFWAALGLEIIISLSMFVYFSIRSL